MEPRTDDGDNERWGRRVEPEEKLLPLEPAVQATSANVNYTMALASIAISLKRIADAIAGSETRLGDIAYLAEILLGRN